MSTEYQIRSSYNSSINTADELDSIAGSLTNLANSDFDGVMAALGNAWQGENADRFVQKGYAVKEQILHTAKEIRNAAAELRNDARVVYNTEMRALEIAAKEAQEKASQDSAIIKSELKASLVINEKIKKADKLIYNLAVDQNGGKGSFGGGGGGSR